MSNANWLASLNQILTVLRAKNEVLRVAIVGVGQELCGDDAVGIMIIRNLKNCISNQSQILLIEGGVAPENYTGQLRRYKPDLVLLIDAADLNNDPGSVCCISCEETTGLSFSTHTMPLHVLSKFITTEFECCVMLIGIQPSQLKLGQLVSPVIREAAKGVSELLVVALDK